MTNSTTFWSIWILSMNIFAIHLAFFHKYLINTISSVGGRMKAAPIKIAITVRPNANIKVSILILLSYFTNLFPARVSPSVLLQSNSGL